MKGSQLPPWRRPLEEVNREPTSKVYRGLARFVHAMVNRLANRHWSGQEHIPATGPAIIVANHISNADPVLLGEYLIWSGRWVHYLGKSEIWKVPGLGWLARSCEQIPVYRGSERAAESLVHARAALDRGQIVGIYPEGTITKDPDGWPMTGRRGAAELALLSGAPVIPVVQVGAEKILGGPTIKLGGLLRGRHDVWLRAGDPIAFDDLRGQELTKATADALTERFLDTLTRMRAEITGEVPPDGRWDLRVGARVQPR